MTLTTPFIENLTMKPIKPTVLIIEDEATMAEILADNLAEEGYDVTVAPDGRAGQNAWERLSPNLVVLDVMLPFVDGYSLCERMRGSGRRHPGSFFKRQGRPRGPRAGLLAGGDDYLPKPFHLPEFLLRVQNMLKRQRWSRETALERLAGRTTRPFLLAGTLWTSGAGRQRSQTVTPSPWANASWASSNFCPNAKTKS